MVQIMAWRRSGDKPLSYLNQWWLVYRRIYASLSLNEFEKIWCWCISFSLHPVVSQWCMHMCFSELGHHCFNKSGVCPYNGLVLNPILTFIVNWTLGNKLQRNLNQNMKLFIEENTFENVVCKILAILFRGLMGYCLSFIVQDISRILH